MSDRGINPTTSAPGRGRIRLDPTRRRPIDPPNTPAWTWDRRDLIALAALVALGVGARAATIGPGLVRLDDPDNYLALARSLAAGEGFRLGGRLTAYRPPLYPLGIAAILRVVGPAHLALGLSLAHLGFGGVAIALVADTARRWGLPRPGAALAAAVAAVDPVLVAQARSAMTETLAATLVAFTLWGLARRGWRGSVLGGLGFGLAALCRPSLLPAAGLSAAVGLMIGPGDWWSRAGRSALLIAVAGATLLPWAIRNAWAVGEPVATTTHGGYTLLLANNPVYYAEVLDGPPGAVWSGPNQAAWFAAVNRRTAHLPEPAIDRLLRHEAIAFARERPRDFLRAGAARLGRFWGVMPAAGIYPESIRWLTAAGTIPLWAITGIGLVRRSTWGWPRVAAPLLLASLSAIHAAYWTDLRMRAPVVPAVGLIAGGALPRPRAAGSPPRMQLVDG